MTTLVTGADGLLGSHLVRELLARGSEVRAMLVDGSDSPTLDGVAVERVTGDLLDRDSLREAVRGVDRVVHAAALTDQFAPDERHWAVNLDGTRNIAEVAMAEGVKRMLHVGSASAFEFGPREAPGDEGGGFPAAYTGQAYMQSKHAAMVLMADLAANRGLDVVIVAPTFLLGDHDWRPSSGELILEYLNRGLPLVPPGGRNFVAATDVATAAVNALERGATGDCTILGGHNLTYDEFFTLVAECAGASPRRGGAPPRVMAVAGQLGDVVGAVGRGLGRGPTRLGRDLAGLSVLGTYYSAQKAHDQLDMPTTPIRSAIRASLRSLRRFGHLPPDPLDGKVALISGASRGVGRATAAALAHRGVGVVMTARGEERLAASRDEIAATGAEVLAVTGDVGRWDDAQAMVDAAVGHFGRLDVLVNNAGVSMRGDFEDLAPEVCSQIVSTNLMGPIHLTRAAARHIKATRGHVLFVSSIAGIVGLPGASIYCATKSALSGLSESLRLELGPAGVHVGVVCMGFTENDPDKRVLGADGSAMLPGRPAHHSQAQVADAIVEMILERRRQVILTPLGTVADRAHRISPGLVERIIARARDSGSAVFAELS
jgi:dihydroflavonol-4-reductase